MPQRRERQAFCSLRGAISSGDISGSAGDTVAALRTNGAAVEGMTGM
jgi:hypothetical protein